MGLTERHWFENEDVPENYEWALEDAVYNSRTSKKPEDSALTGRGGMMMADRDSVINDLDVAKRILCNPQMLTPEMCVRIGQSVTNALALIREQQEQLKAHEWRRFEFKELTEEEKAEHPEWCYVIENTPDEGEILASDGKYVWKDEFCNNGVECYLDSGHEMERCWWMPLPELPKEG